VTDVHPGFSEISCLIVGHGFPLFYSLFILKIRLGMQEKLRERAQKFRIQRGELEGTMKLSISYRF